MFSRRSHCLLLLTTRRQHPHVAVARTKSTAAAAATAAASPRRQMARNTAPIPCYNLTDLPGKKGPPGLYDDVLRTAVADGKATLVQELEIPPCDARSWKVPAGHLWRIICTTGPQVADQNCWNLHNPQERFYSSKTRQIHATHLSRGDRLWSNMPYIRPIATIVEDTIDYGFDEDGAGVHDVIGSRCDPYTHWLITKGEDFNNTCHSNLTRQAMQHDGLTEMDVHDVLNVFMCTGFTKDTQQYFTKPSPVDVGDYIEFLAEIDLLVSVSACPQGDVSVACGSGDEKPKVYPLGIQVHKLDDGVLDGWSPSDENGYAGNHGL